MHSYDVLAGMMALAALFFIAGAILEHIVGRRQQLPLIIATPWKLYGGSAVLIALVALAVAAAMAGNTTMFRDVGVLLLFIEAVVFVFLLIEAMRIVPWQVPPVTTKKTVD